MKRLGKFEISADLIERLPGEAAAIFRLLRCVPVQAGILSTKQYVEYVALSELFDEVPEHETIPEYEIIIRYDEHWWPVEVNVRRKE